MLEKAGNKGTAEGAETDRSIARHGVAPVG